MRAVNHEPKAKQLPFQLRLQLADIQDAAHTALPKKAAKQLSSEVTAAAGEQLAELAGGHMVMC